MQIKLLISIINHPFSFQMIYDKSREINNKKQIFNAII